MSALIIQHATKRFSGGVTALDDLSIELRDGEFLTIVGPSGSGKTTLLRCIAGLEKLDAGTIRLGDRLLDGLPAGQRNVAMMFQQPAYIPICGFATTLHFRCGCGEQRSEIPGRVGEIAARLGIELLLDRRPNELSGGQAQRVALARALVRKPMCLLLDEPLSNLDTLLRAELRGEFKAIHAATSVGMLHVTHDQIEALELGERVAVLNAGRLEQIGTPVEILRQPANAFVANFFRYAR